VRSAADVLRVKRMINDGNKTKVIAKIEKPEAVDNINSIIQVSDAIMVARGDLGVETPLEQVPLVQKHIVKQCAAASKPVIIATQILESMITNPNATRAEATDIANAVIDGADALMLSGETSVGKYPVEAVRTMNKVLQNTERIEGVYNRPHEANPNSPTYLSDAVCYNACTLAKEVKAKAIIGMTRSGYTAFMVASYRPQCEIYLFTDNKNLLYILNLTWGCKAFYYDKFVSTDETISDIVGILRQRKLVRKGDVLINLASMPMQEQARTNMMKVTEVK
jgi:pyruvate kinase